MICQPAPLQRGVHVRFGSEQQHTDEHAAEVGKAEEMSDERATADVVAEEEAANTTTAEARAIYRHIELGSSLKVKFTIKRNDIIMGI